jgi:hypothetical protein
MLSRAATRSRAITVRTSRTAACVLPFAQRSAAPQSKSAEPARGASAADLHGGGRELAALRRGVAVPVVDNGIARPVPAAGTGSHGGPARRGGIRHRVQVLRKYRLSRTDRPGVDGALHDGRRLRLWRRVWTVWQSHPTVSPVISHRRALPPGVCGLLHLRRGPAGGGVCGGSRPQSRGDTRDLNDDSPAGDRPLSVRYENLRRGSVLGALETDEVVHQLFAAGVGRSHERRPRRCERFIST